MVSSFKGHFSSKAKPAPGITRDTVGHGGGLTRGDGR